MSEKELIQCRKYFWSQDKNQDGKVSRTEFVAMCDKIGLRLRDREKLKAFNMVDKNNDGYITFAEFVATYFTNDKHYGTHGPQQNREPMTALSPQKLSLVHQYFWDKSKTKEKAGNLTRIEFVQMMPILGINMSNDDLNKAFDIADNNKDQMISFEEFVAQFVPGSNWSRNPPHSVHYADEDHHYQPHYHNNEHRSITNAAASRQQHNVVGVGDVKLEHDITELCKYFWSADLDSDGKLSRQEFNQLLEHLGMSEKLNKQQMNRAFKFADCDRSGSISFKEFINAYLNTKDREVLGNDQIKELFFKCDTDHHGSLTKQQCIECMQLLGLKFEKGRADKMMEKIDLNHDNCISLSEFCEFLDVKK